MLLRPLDGRRKCGIPSERTGVAPRHLHMELLQDVKRCQDLGKK